jgi:octaheme c-type cytochrome (tetrathionate reductase family)
MPINRVSHRGVVPLLLCGVLAFIFLHPAGAADEHATATQKEEQPDANMNFRIISQVPPSHRSDPEATADHSKFEVLQQEFKAGPEVTEACLKCHTETGKHFMKSIHWTWEYKHPTTGQMLGKKTLVNNFCTNARGNEGMCAQCHAGYGWKDESFNFRKQQNIDCLVCHDRTGSYYKTPNSKGNEACTIMFEGKPPINWKSVAQSVGLPGRENCGACHFYGGGGDGVKHGDLDSSLAHPDKSLDVHMDEKGLNFSCTSCHMTKNHVVSGSRYNVLAKDTGGTGKPGMRRGVATCESCHSATPHESNEFIGLKLNNHTRRVACQSCHIPTMARGGVATKLDWDWRTAGKTKDGQGYKEKNYTQGNGEHRATYKSIKGSFKYGENLVPEYHWFNGQMKYTTIDDRFDPAKQPIPINALQGSADDPGSRLWPFKRMHTIQPYDKGNNILVYMHLWGADDNAFWGNYDFGNAIKAGMTKNKRAYSGDFGFIETNSFWPITHMVAPKEKALSCAACHSKEGRLQGVNGVYLPGRDANRWLDLLGLLALGATVLGVLGHATIRLLTAKGRKG